MESNCCNTKPYFAIGYAHGIKMADDDKYYGICGRCKENAEFIQTERKTNDKHNL